MENFVPLQAFSGGILIGIAATLLLLLNGKILGASGIIARALFCYQGKSFWEVFFLAGLVLGAFFYQFTVKEPLAIVIDASVSILIIAGLLVGFGTSLGSGCTSGHGVCGIARFSMRSVIATMAFMLSGIITVYIVRHVLGGSM